MRYISPDGKRQDAASRYLHPRLQDGNHPSLHVLLETKIVRVLFDDKKRAIGVECKSGSSMSKIKSRKLVILSCGACGTPSVLEGSGVGEEYQDHELLSYPYRSSLKPGETLDAIISGRSNVQDLIKNNDPILGWNSMDITCKLRPSAADIEGLGPDYEKTRDLDFKYIPEKPAVLISVVNGFPGDPSSIPAGQYIGSTVFTAHPYSRGHLRITGPDLSNPLDFETGFFTDADNIDIKQHMWAYKKQREIARRMQTYRGEVISCHPPFPASSKAVCVEPDAPLVDVKDIEYTFEDDVILEKWLRQNVGTTWHSVGTCKMAPLENKGVVDANLRVHGVEGLRIADLSILPHNIAANTNNTALAVGEKAADIFMQELGLGRNY